MCESDYANKHLTQFTYLVLVHIPLRKTEVSNYARVPCCKEGYEALFASLCTFLLLSLIAKS